MNAVANAMDSGKYTLTRSQVAEQLGISTSSVRRLEYVRLHPVSDARGVWRFDPDEVQAVGPRAGLRGRGRRAGNGKGAGGAARGRTAARVFTLFAARRSLPEIVIATKLPPHAVRTLYSEWRMSLEDGERAGRRSQKITEP